MQWFDHGRTPELAGDRTWYSIAWKGERVNRQILIAGLERADAFSVTATDLLTEAEVVEAIPAGAVSFRYPAFVKGDPAALSCGSYHERGEPAMLADALLAAPAATAMRTDDEPYPAMLWVSIDVPPEAASGEYAGTIRIEDPAGRETALEVRLRVTDWSLPPRPERRFHLDLWQFPVSVLDRYNDANPGQRIEPWSERHYRLLEPFYTYLASLGQRALTTYIKDQAFSAPSMIEWIALDGGERWEYDYSAFDAHVQRLAEWGLDGQIDAFSPVGWNAGEIPYQDRDSGQRKTLHAPVGSSAFNERWDHFLTDFRLHLLEKGWFDRTVLFMDEVPEAQVADVLRLARSNHSDWKLGLAYARAPSRGVLASLHDRSGVFDIEEDAPLAPHPSRVVTFYTSCQQQYPNSFVAADASPADLAAMAWHAALRDYDGYLRWAYDNWKLPDPLDARDGAHTAGDFALVYRSGNGEDMTVVPSVRSELLRDGIEDYEKIQVLTDIALLCDANYRMNPDSNALEKCALRGLRGAVRLFSSYRLKLGQAPQLIPEARRVLDAISMSVTPDSYPDCF